MTKIDALRRFLLPCFYSSAATSASVTTITPKKRISTSLRDDIPDNEETAQDQEDGQESPSTASTATATPRPSKTMVIGTIFGQRRGHVWFCIQNERFSAKPAFLLELSIPIHQLVKEMQSGLVRIALECDASELGSCPLHSIPLWTMYCNGRKLGFAERRKASERVLLMLETMKSITVGAGVIPSGSSDSGEIMYMRANYEHMVGSSDSESFHLINPDHCPGQELSVFLLRTR